MGPPTIVTFQKPSRGRSRSRIRDEDMMSQISDRSRFRDEEMSQISFDDEAQPGSISGSTVVSCKYHPFVWILLMLMAVTIHGWYQTLFGGGEPFSIYYARGGDDRIQRQTSELDDDVNDRAVDMSSLVMSLIQSESEDSSTLLRGGSSKLLLPLQDLLWKEDIREQATEPPKESNVLPPAQDLSQVIIQQEPEDVGDDTHPPHD